MRRGGSSIFARSVFLAYGSQRKVILADSFEGLPHGSTTKYDPDKFFNKKYLSVSIDVVKENFNRFGIYDENKVVFIVGFFNKTMPEVHRYIQELAVLRIDGDMYESCFDVINNLYAHVTVGGYVFIDDWTGFDCNVAVIDFRKELGIAEEIIEVTSSESGVYWKKQRNVKYDTEILKKKYIIPYLRQK